MPVDQRDARVVRVLRELVDAPEPGEAAPDDKHMRLLHDYGASSTEIPQ